MLSLLVPHKRTPENDRALAVALRCATENYRFSESGLRLDWVVDDRPICPYKCWNEMIANSKTELVVLSNSDVFFGPGWNLPYERFSEPHLYLSGTLVEPGVIGVASCNIHKDFGRTPEKFRRKEFEQWVLTQPAVKYTEERGWCMPCCLQKSDFLELGGFDPKRGTFPEPLDLHFIDRWLAKGWKMGTCSSYAAHLQNWSGTFDKECRK